ncbi:xanthine dehydrogenase family protein subunit M [Actinomadura sp. 7K534]|uniref:FAD binding domain-containing protein n=1 Tax=Actinomadura sp. 7K534 TaxID=2530366 RepID=UPI00104574F3|nr:xanthine dehydrogenase family protein subunit M [Actinomadura sp. 7K534]TDB92189.1 xanthine dehydrogenase family protein subunit M [Actinomadura sp. 7K534]
MQVPANFEYEKATTVEETLALLARHGDEARVVAGGHSLLPMMKLRLAQPEALIDINDVAELARIRIEGGVLCVGALVRHAELLDSPVAGEHFPILHDAERVIADPVVRNRGTVGGSLCQADPSEDLSAAFGALKASAVIRGPDGERTVSLREFHTGPYETVVEPGELLIELRIPIRPGVGGGGPPSGGRYRHGSAYEKVERRVGDWPLAAAGAALWLEGGRIADAGIGLTAVRAEHFVAPEAEEVLRGAVPSEDVFAEAGRVAAEHCDPGSDQRGPADYKRHLAGELTTRALRRAYGRSQA